MATAGSYDELQAQVDTINAYTDRTEAQRQYLVQKSITRYWMDQIGQRGGGKQLIDKMYAHSIDPGNMKGRLNNAAYDFQRVHDEDPYDEQPWVNQYDNTSYTDMSNIPAWVMPWQNAGEGVLPDDMHLVVTINVEMLGNPFAGLPTVKIDWEVAGVQHLSFS